jgi:pyridoxamine 5'-phosphate oxidase
VHEDDFAADPLVQLGIWLGEALPAGEPQSMTVATADLEGNPSARVVLLRGVDERGLTFFTNRDSRKGEELRRNPRAAVLLHWSELGRQVRVEGRVEETTPEESLDYWHTRPRASQIAAWASPQSSTLVDRHELLARVEETRARFAGDEEVPLPPFWGGYRVVPEVVEFWTHRDDRLHDRVRYRRSTDGWGRERLAP